MPSWGQPHKAACNEEKSFTGLWHVCSTVVSTSEFLLGNLSKFKKDITDANKLTKNMRSPSSPPPLHKSGRATPTRTVRMDPFLVVGQPDFIHINIRDPKVLIFLGRSPYPKFKKKRNGARRTNAIDTQGMWQAHHYCTQYCCAELACSANQFSSW